MAQRIGSGTGTPKTLSPPPVNELERASATLDSIRQIVEAMSAGSLEQDREPILDLLGEVTDAPHRISLPPPPAPGVAPTPPEKKLPPTPATRRQQPSRKTSGKSPKI